MSRWKAASIHLAISAVIGLLIAALLFGLWYPPPYFRVAGATTLILVLLGVDLVLGPLLTLVVFRSGKPSLRFDLTVIALLQAGALLYGLGVIAQARPVFIVGVVDRFSLVAANQLDPADLTKARFPQFASLSWTGPRWAIAQRPEDSTERSDIMFSALEGKDLDKYPRHYVPYAEGVTELLARAQTLRSLTQRHPDYTARIQDWLQDSKRSEKEVIWLPLDARNGSLTVLLSAESGEVLGTLPVDPW